MAWAGRRGRGSTRCDPRSSRSRYFTCPGSTRRTSRPCWRSCWQRSNRWGRWRRRWWSGSRLACGGGRDDTRGSRWRRQSRGDISARTWRRPGFFCLWGPTTKRSQLPRLLLGVLLRNEANRRACCWGPTTIGLKPDPHPSVGRALARQQPAMWVGLGNEANCRACCWGPWGPWRARICPRWRNSLSGPSGQPESSVAVGNQR